MSFSFRDFVSGQTQDDEVAVGALQEVGNGSKNLSPGRKAKEVPSKNRKTKRSRREASNGEKVNEQETNEGGPTPENKDASIQHATLARLDALYGSFDQPSGSQLVRSIANPLLPPSQLARSPKELVRKRKRNARRRARADSDEEEEERPKSKTELEEIARKEEHRIRQIDREREWNQVRAGWRNRNVDLRGETDVGGAIQAAVLESRKRQPPPPPPTSEAVRKTRVIAQDVTAASPSSVGGDEDAEDQVLNRLVQTVGEKADESKEQTGGAGDLRPERDRLGFWALGMVAPRVDSSLYQSAPLPQPKIKSVAQKDACDQGAYPGLRVYSLQRVMDQREALTQNEGLLPSRAHPASVKFQHQRQLVRLSARFLMGAGNEGSGEESIADRMVQLLWKRGVAEASSNAVVESQAVLCGRRLQFFLERSWEEPRTIMEKVGIARDVGLVGPIIARKHGLLVLQRKLRAHGVARNESFVQSVTHYVPIPGTMPPVPTFPLHALGFEFGPTDKFNFIHDRETVSEESLVQSVALSFTRWLNVTKEDGGKRAELEHQMSTMIERSVQLHSIKLHKRLRLRSQPIDELPLLPVYRSMMVFCRLAANSGENPAVSSGRVAGTRAGGYGGLKASSRLLFDFLESSILSNGLQSFPRLHLVFALLRISSVLPEDAIRILAAPLDSASVMTPYLTMQHLLEHLESEGLLVEKKDDEWGVEVGQLEYAFFQACESIRKCVQLDPTEPDYHSWYIAIKAGSLILCSGNRAGSGARLFASSMAMVDELVLAVDKKKAKRRKYEARVKLPKFRDLRAETAKAYQLLLSLAQHQNSPRCHQAVASFCEWRQAIALLVGDCEGPESHFEEIRRMHKVAMMRWASSEQSKVSREYGKRSRIDRRTLADSLERKPEEPTHWRRLVRALGSVKSSSTTSLTGDCVSEDSPDRLPSSTKLEHKKDAWASDRSTWWPDHLLSLSFPDTELQGDLYPLRCKATSSLADGESAENTAGVPGMDGEISLAGNESVQWLQACIDQSQKTKAIDSSTGKNERYDKQLPKTIAEVLENPRRSDLDALGRPFLGLEGLSVEDEVVCYKALIRCHICGTQDAPVTRVVNYYWQSVWDPQSQTLYLESPKWRSLEWLHRMGVDILSQLPEEPALEVIPRDMILYPPAMREVLAAGVAVYGARSWARIQKENKDIFAGHHRRKAEKCYGFMVKAGLLESKIPDETCVFDAILL